MLWDRHNDFTRLVKLASAKRIVRLLPNAGRSGALSNWDATPFTLAMLIVARTPRSDARGTSLLPARELRVPRRRSRQSIRVARQLTASAHLPQVLDQFARHVHRDAPRERLAATDTAALDCCERLLARGWAARLSVPELVFALMPLRHSATVPRLERVLQEARARRISHPPELTPSSGVR